MMEKTADPSQLRAFDEIASGLESRFRHGVEPWAQAEFEEWAMICFRHQFETCETYRAFCAGRGVEPGSISAWEDVPAVPASAFKHFDFVSGSMEADARVFRTSGTTRGVDQRGRHTVVRPELYRASLMAPFETALLPEGTGLAFISLIPSLDEAPDSSLSFMVGAAAEELATRTHWLVSADGIVDEGELMAATARAREEAVPVVLLGTAASFAHVLELGPRGLGPLPQGSRVMETGGFKGAGRAIPRAELYRAVADATGLSTDRIVNEYGMTELLSQLYEPVLTEGPSAVGVHVPPPWLGVRALDPVTLDPVEEGERGILAFFDLANLGSVSHILTEDVGSIAEGRVRLEGRARGAEPRGCSRAMDDLMAAARRGA